MRRFAAVIISVMLIITVMAPMSFAAVSTNFSYNESLTTDEHYPGQLYEYYFEPDADLDDVSMTFSVKSGGSAIVSRKFTKDEDDNEYVLSFYVSPSIDEYKDVDFEATCKEKGNSSNQTTITGTFHCGFEGVNHLYNDGSDEYYIDNESPIYEFDENINSAKLVFDNRSYFVTRISDSGDDNINLYYSEQVNSDIANKTDANVEFMNFCGNPTFDILGTFYLCAPNAKYAYSYDGTTLTQLNATDEGDFLKFKTRTLGNFIASDKPLSGAVTTSGSSSSQGSAFQDISSSSVAPSSKAVVASSSKSVLPASSKAVVSSKPVVASSKAPVISSSSSVASSSSSISSSSESVSSSSSSSSSTSSSSSEQAANTAPEARKNGSNIILIVGAVIATIGVVSLTAALLTKKK